MRKILQSLDEWLQAIEDAVLIGIMIALFSLVALQVVARFTASPPSWTEEMSRYLMVWLMFIGAAVCVRHNEHVGFLLLSDLLGQRLRDFVRRCAQIVTLFLMLILLVQGAVWVGGLLKLGQVTIAFNIPIYWVGLAVPVAGFIGALHAVRHLFDTASDASEPTRAE